MSRLTKKDRYGHWYTNEDIHDRMLGGEPYPHAYDGKPIDKLAKYEDLEEQCVKDNLFGLHELCEKWKAFYKDIEELLNYRKKQEQGLLIKLKVPLGTKIWYLSYEEDFEQGWWEIACGIYSLSWIHYHENKEFYLTRSEAEEALAKMKKED